VAGWRGHCSVLRPISICEFLWIRCVHRYFSNILQVELWTIWAVANEKQRNRLLNEKKRRKDKEEKRRENEKTEREEKKSDEKRREQKTREKKRRKKKEREEMIEKKIHAKWESCEAAFSDSLRISVFALPFVPHNNQSSIGFVLLKLPPPACAILLL